MKNKNKVTVLSTEYDDIQHWFNNLSQIDKSNFEILYELKCIHNQIEQLNNFLQSVSTLNKTNKRIE